MSTKVFQGKTAWVIGASSGIGAELALQLHRAGAQLLLSSRNAANLEKVRAACGPQGPAVHVLPLDLEQSASFPALVRTAEALTGGIDYLFLNSGIAERDYALNTLPEVDRKLMEVNYFGLIFLAKQVLPVMLERQRGHIVVTTSIAGKFGVPRAAAYSATKHALHGFFDSLRAELAPQPIWISIVIPGRVSTEITLHGLKGDGSPFARMEQGQLEGISAQECAGRILKAVARRRQEAFVGGGALDRLSLIGIRLFPQFTQYVIRSHPLKWLRKMRRLLPF